MKLCQRAVLANLATIIQLNMKNKIDKVKRSDSQVIHMEEKNIEIEVVTSSTLLQMTESMTQISSKSFNKGGSLLG